MPIQLIWGDDIAGCEKAIESFIHETTDPSWRSLNITRLDGNDVLQAKQALEEARTLPFGNGGRVILLKKSPICNNCPAELNNLFEDLIDVIPKTTHLILNNISKPDQRLKNTKKLKELIANNKAIEKSFLLPSIWDSNGQKEFIIRSANNLKINLTDEAVFTLIEAVGTDSYRISSELEKLALLVESKNDSTSLNKSQEKITKEDVKNLVNGISTNSLRISDILLKNNLGEAIYLIDCLLDAGEPALRILATLTGQVRGCLWVLLLGMEGEKDIAKIAKSAGIGNPKRVFIMKKQIQGKDSKELLRLLNQLLKVEASLKKGESPKAAFRDGLLTSN